MAPRFRLMPWSFVPLALACLGCSGGGPSADVELKILTEPSKITRMHVWFEGDEFDVPRDHFDDVLAAMEPTGELHTATKCVVIADVEIEGKDAQKLSLLLHTHHHPYEFAAHTPSGKENYIQYVGKDADRLKRTLEAAREAAAK